MNVKKFEKSKSVEMSAFTEVHVPAIPVVETSLLGELIKSAPAPQKPEEATRSERIKVKVFVGDVCLEVEVPKVATVGELIWSSIQQYEEENRQPALIRQTRAYLLKMAEEDGSQEDMVLKYTDKFSNFGQFFALVANPAYEASLTSGSAAANKGTVRISNPPGGPDGQATVRGGGLASGFRKGTLNKRAKGAAGEGEAEDELMKVKMPDGSHTTVKLSDSAPASELLEKCCSKRKFEADRYHLEFIDDGENVPDSATVAQIRDRAIELVANSEIAGLDTYMSDRKAMQYEVFKVLKIKKGIGAGKPQERVLGIDSDRISNGIPEDSTQVRGAFRKAMDGVRSAAMGTTQEVKNTHWLIADLVDATVDAERNKQFVLRFRQGAAAATAKQPVNLDASGKSISTSKSSNVIVEYRYEAETPKIAKQVVAKLTRLVELYNR